MRVGICKHFTGTPDECCAAGVRYADVVTEPENRTGRALRLPCRSIASSDYSPSQLEHFNRRGKCDKYQDPTLAEVIKHYRDFEAYTERFVTKVLPVCKRIKQDHAGAEWHGTEKCPECGGVLHLTHSAYNGHVHGKCETKNCLSWME